MALRTVFFPERNGEYKYTKAIVPEDKIEFFEEKGALLTQYEAEQECDVFVADDEDED